MADDKSKTSGGDRKRVAGDQGYEVSYFARKHGLSAKDARALIERFGNDRSKLNTEAEKLAKTRPSDHHRKSTRSVASTDGGSQTDSTGRARRRRISTGAKAAAVGGVVAAGALLWSRRTAVSGQISKLSNQISARGKAGRGEDGQPAEGTTSLPTASNSGRSQVEIAEEALTLKNLGDTRSESLT